MKLKDKILDKLEFIGQELTKYWYVDITVAMIGVIIYLVVQKIRKNKT